MKTIYSGFSYKILCDGREHLWKALKRPPLSPARIFAQKFCDCARLKEMGVALPMKSALKVALNYMAPGCMVTIARYAESGKPE